MKTAWEQALETAETECPYRPMCGTEERKALPEDERCARVEEDGARDPWLEGFPFGILGVPDDLIYDRTDRYFWQGYEAGVAARKEAKR